MPTPGRWTAFFDAQAALAAMVQGLNLGQKVAVFTGFPPMDKLPREWVAVAGQTPEPGSQDPDLSGVPGRGQGETFTIPVIFSTAGSTHEYAPGAQRIDEMVTAFRAALIADPTLGGDCDSAWIAGYEIQETVTEQSQRGMDAVVRIAIQAYIN